METENRKIKKSIRSERQDFRMYLQDQLSARCSKNPRYSLRSFSKALNLSPSALSAMLSGKRPITNKMKNRLGLQLGLTLEEIVQMSAKPHGNSKQVTNTTANKFHQLTIDTFNIISEPHHYAILELMKTHDFKLDSKWISQRLNHSIVEINIAIERLERVGLIKKTEDGNFKDTTDGFTTDIQEGLSSQGQRRFQKKSLEHAASLIELVPIENRDNTSMTMAINKDDLPEAKRLIKQFRRNFSSKLESANHLDEVYQLTIAFMPLTNLNGGSK
jgi:uncharacterized protein (TIGR02147 family)